MSRKGEGAEEGSRKGGEGKKERGTQISLLALPCTLFALPVSARAPASDPNGRPCSDHPPSPSSVALATVCS